MAVKYHIGPVKDLQILGPV